MDPCTNADKTHFEVMLVGPAARNNPAAKLFYTLFDRGRRSDSHTYCI